VVIFHFSVHDPVGFPYGMSHFGYEAVTFFFLCPRKPDRLLRAIIRD
jgi:hypothetical protein